MPVDLDELKRLARDVECILAVGDHPGWKLLGVLGPNLLSLISLAREAEGVNAKLAEADSLVLLTTMRAEAAETSLAALKAENERLREACRHIVDAGDDGDEMTAVEKARTALETTNG